MTDYREFLNLLERKSSRAVLFEPLPSRKIITQLIWRGGDHLWNTVGHRVSTLIEFYSYIRSDVAVIPTDGELSSVLERESELPAGMRFVVITDDPAELAEAERQESVCATATRNGAVGRLKPTICLARDGESADESFARFSEGGFAAVYLRERAEEYRARAVVLGGLGSEYLSSAGPLDIYDRVRALAGAPGAAVGSGGVGEYIEYQGFISMLGIYNKLN